VSEDAAKRLAQLKAALQSGIIDDDTYHTAVAALSSATVTQADISGSGAIAQQGSVAAGAGGIAIGGNVHGNVYVGPPPRDKAHSRRIYLNVLAGQVNQLPLRAFDAGQSNPKAKAQELSLVNVYTALNTTEQVKREPSDGKQRKAREAELLERDEMRPLRALEAAARQHWLVLLGEPGSGKTTFVHHLIYCLARHEVEGAETWLNDFRRDWPDADCGLLPVRVILRDFDVWLAKQGRPPGRAQPIDLHDFIAQTLHQQQMDFAVELIDEALDAGQALVVLDGLDEVTSLTQRTVVGEALAVFAGRYRANRYLVTCRTWSYQPPDADDLDLRLPDERFLTAQLAPFNDEQIAQFVAAWHAELQRTGKLSAAKAAALQPKLGRAVQQPDLRRLAVNPLQLTLMAWVHTDDEELPDKRAKLYARAVDLLLWRWESQKPERPGEHTLRDLAAEVADGRGEIERVLWRVAFQAHAQLTDADQRANPERLMDVGEAPLKQALARLKKDAQGKPDENWARDVVDAIRERSGLLARRLPGTLTFPHRTFQEYLAALWLLQDRFVTQAAEKAEQFDVWREVILLAIGHSVYVKQDYELEKPLLLVRKLCPARYDDTDAAWRKVWLAGDALLEMGVPRATEMDAETMQRVQSQLVQLLTGAKLPPRERAAGNTLARLGDLRPGVMDVDALPLCFVPKGRFWLGSEEPDAMVLLPEKPLKQFDLNYDYWISRWPITNAQYMQFVEDGGYHTARYWTEAQHAEVWRNDGIVKARYEEDWSDRPYDFGEPFKLANHPVVGVMWYEALAFTRWLTDRWHTSGRLPNNWVVRLPNEPEWEKAARGGLEIPSQPIVRSEWEMIDQTSLTKNPQPQRRYPWGDEPDPALANYGDTEINATSAVGCFPAQTFNPYGCEDLSGNVWEWMRNTNKKYPYKADDGREKLDSTEARVLRGGAFRSGGLVRCAYRYYNLPFFRYDSFGFRLVVSPF
jgi:formylglycine-generating enzyme required for sulfatase activity